MFTPVNTYLFSVKYAIIVTLMEPNTSPISGATLSRFCNVTVLNDDDPESRLKYAWFRDDTPLTHRDTYFGLDTEQINITVSSNTHVHVSICNSECIDISFLEM